MKHYSEEERGEAVRMYRAGMDLEQITSKFGCSPSIVYKWVTAQEMREKEQSSPLSPSKKVSTKIAYPPPSIEDIKHLQKQIQLLKNLVKTMVDSIH